MRSRAPLQSDNSRIAGRNQRGHCMNPTQITEDYAAEEGFNYIRHSNGSTAIRGGNSA
jgi:hypothetical protein